MKYVSKFWEYTLVGLVVGLIFGVLSSFMSGNRTFGILLVGTVGTVVGIVLGIVHRND